MSRRKSYPSGRVVSKEEMLAVADVFAKEDTEDGLDTRRVDGSKGKEHLKRQAVRDKYAKWLKSHSVIVKRVEASMRRLGKIQANCEHLEETGFPPRDGFDGQYACKDCGRVRRVPQQDAPW